MSYPKCGECGVSGVKMWREYSTFLNDQTFRCIDCACKEDGADASTAREDGTVISNEIRSHSIGWRVPAVPDGEGTYWGYTANIPADDLEFWNKLPLRSPVEVKHA
jgi:hypothetical protein